MKCTSVHPEIRYRLKALKGKDPATILARAINELHQHLVKERDVVFQPVTVNF